MKGRIAYYVCAALSLALAVLCVFVIFRTYDDVGIYALLCALIWLFMPFEGLLHEFGHMLFGSLVKIQAVPNLRFWRSFSCGIKPRTDKNLKGRIIFTTAGGVALNLLSLILGIVALCVPAVPVGLCVITPAAFYFFALNALPLYLSDGKTDGLVIAELVKNDDSAQVMLAVLTVQAQMLKGKPIEEIDEKLLFGVPQIREDDMNFIALTELRYEYFKAKGDTASADKYLKRFEELKQYSE